MKATMVHPSGLKKEVPVGFSWTVFFFGVFVPLLRGDIKWAAIFFAVTALVGVLTAGLGVFVPGIVFSFVYNKLYIKDLIEKGYAPEDEVTKQILLKNKIEIV